MERLASYFVSMVVFAHAVFPQANLPAVLGVSVVQATDATDSGEVVGESDVLQTVREERRQELEAARTRRAQALQTARTNQDAFRQRLSLIQDERKSATLVEINEKLAAINTRYTTRLDNLITRFTELLAKITSRTRKAQDRGYDVSAVREAIVAAGDALDSAQEAVNTQAEKVYVIEITDEESLGAVVRAAITQLRADLQATKVVVTAAKDAVTTALRLLAALRGVDEI